jgi:hypothetical protein
MEPAPLVTVLESKPLSVNKATKAIEKFISEHSNREINLTLTNTEQETFISDDTIIKLRSVLASISGVPVVAANNGSSKKRTFDDDDEAAEAQPDAVDTKKIKKEKKEKKEKQ